MKKTDYLFEKIVSEVKKIKDLNSLKEELSKLTKEIQVMGKPLEDQFHKKLKDLESKYEVLKHSIGEAQKKVEDEFSKALVNIQNKRQETEKKLKQFRQNAMSHHKDLTSKVMKIKKDFSVNKKAKSKKVRKSHTSNPKQRSPRTKA